MPTQPQGAPNRRTFEYFASCPTGFEAMLGEELTSLHLRRVRPLQGGVAFFGTQAEGYRACLWSRLASRIICIIARVSAFDAQTLYAAACAIPWEIYIGPYATISVRAQGGNQALRNTQFVALKIKDAICDRLRSIRGMRPNVAQQRPDVPIHVTIHNNRAAIALDYSGEPLHRRGYRASHIGIEAPVKETLAAGLLIWGGWDKVVSSGMHDQKRTGAEERTTPVFVDPTCGSGTIVLEAAMIAADRAPGLSREYWGFEGNANFDADAFDALLNEADMRFEAGQKNMPLLIGADSDSYAIEAALDSASYIDLTEEVIFVQADCANLDTTLKSHGVSLSQDHFQPATSDDTPLVGFLAFNPPYGVRLLSDTELAAFYEKLARGLRSLDRHWAMRVLTADPFFDSAIGYEADQALQVRNGPLHATMRSYTLGMSFFTEIPVYTLEGEELRVGVSSATAVQFAGRLRKMAKLRKKWAMKQNLGAFRVYDADLPDYAVSIDLFLSDDDPMPNVLISEYLAPKCIDPEKAYRRLKDACAITQTLFEIDSDHLFKRTRRHSKGGSQYKKVQSDAEKSPHRRISVREAEHLFEINLSDYLDTGLFLDQRITRALIGALSEGVDFLNLFAYTGTASVYAAAGGAATTTSIDMNRTYLDWARRNMQTAGFTSRSHQYIQADVLQWTQTQAALAKKKRKTAPSFDLIFIDPPTFSNSKSMHGRTWDIQRDHAWLLTQVALLLAPGGKIVFSGNLRTFKIDANALAAAGLHIRDITGQTIPEDFARNPRIHFCYLLSLHI